MAMYARVPVKTDGYHSWTEAEIWQFERHHPVGSRARLAFALLLYTATATLRCGPLGRQHSATASYLSVSERPGDLLRFPSTPRCRRSSMRHRPITSRSCTTQTGQPFSPAGFTNWFRDKCNKAGLPLGTSAHGLRKAACRRLAEAGCSANLIAAVSGHKSLREVQRYTEAADQARMARSAMETDNENIHCQTWGSV